MNINLKNHARKIVAVALMGIAGASQAAIDISPEVTAAKADIATAGGLIIGVVVAVAAVSWVRRVIR
jgi:hypothetical protein